MFPCTGCGVCCQNISNIAELKHFDLGGGVCQHLNIHTNNCEIYEHRPDICKVDRMFETKYFKQFSKEEFYIVNAESCNSLQEKFKINTKYKMKIGE